MPWVREESKMDLLPMACWNFFQLLTVFPYTWGFLPLASSIDLPQGRQAHCSAVASHKEGALPSFAPFEDFVNFCLLTPWDPRPWWATVTDVTYPSGVGAAKQQNKKQNLNKIREPRLFSLWFFYLSLSLAPSLLLLLLASSSTIFHNSRS